MDIRERNRTVIEQFLADHQAKTGRTIPVVVLTRV
jgi:hypothetical protein